MKIQSVILLLGGNQGKVMQVLSSSIALIEKECGHMHAISEVYSTKAWGPVPQADFLNLAIIIKTKLPAGILMKKLLDIEQRFGRKRVIKFGPRTLDIDILFYGNRVIHNQIVNIPHPEIQNRRFVLQPCMDIAPNFIHPILRKKISQLLVDCPDTLEVKLWKN